MRHVSSKGEIRSRGPARPPRPQGTAELRRVRLRLQQARKKLKLEKPKRERRLPQLLTAEELNRFFKAVRDGGQVQHEIHAQAAAVHCRSRRGTPRQHQGHGRRSPGLQDLH